jgi:hypothetical protein
MGQHLFYSHSTPEKLAETIKTAGFQIESLQYHEIGGETFLRVTIAKH